MNESKFKFKFTQKRLALAALTAAVTFIIVLYGLTAKNAPVPLPPEAEQSSSVSESSQDGQEESEQKPPSQFAETVGERYPTDKLFVTGERLKFKTGDLVLRVPRLELTTSIVGEISSSQAKRFANGEMDSKERAAFLRNDNSADLLSDGVMLFNLSPMPGKSNSNVSLSGHRDICGKEFYYIDTISEGDMIYLDYLGDTYAYEYIDTKIVTADDWSPIYCKDFSCVTLISCDPIGTHLNRIVVTGRLVDVTPQQSQGESSFEEPSFGVAA